MDFSVVVCTKDRAKQLAKTLEFYAEIKSAFQWELIVVDNGSTDSTKSIVELFLNRIKGSKYIFEPTQGASRARNTGWKSAVSDLILFCDDDCYPSPSIVDAYFDLFLRNPTVSFFGGQIRLWDSLDLAVTIDLRKEPVDIPPKNFIRAGLHGANIAVRRSVLQFIGGFDENFGPGTRLLAAEDVVLIASACWAGFSGRYDPKPFIYHHHRRRERDKYAMFRAYDIGRGGYFMKFILNRESRYVYLAQCIKSTLYLNRYWKVRMFYRELHGAAIYYMNYRKKQQQLK